MTEADHARVGGALGREELLAQIEGARPLISAYLSLEDQLQPNGFDLTVAEIGQFDAGGAVALTNSGRSLPEVRPLSFDTSGWINLLAGPYQIVFNEIVDLPNDLMALGRPRSTLCRMGATISTAVWDAGYRGRSTALLIVENAAGIRIERGARLLQLVFFTLNAPTVRGYEGAYQGENLMTSRVDQSRTA